MALSTADKKELLELARTSIALALEGKARSDIKLKYFKAFKGEERPWQGAFVTIKIGGELRGCIGFLNTKKPLHEVIAEAALHAAFSDPRFEPLSKEEFEKARLEISLLGPIREVKKVKENLKKIKPGKHGIIIKKGIFEGLLLPQVFTELNIEEAELALSMTCEKAGIPVGSWRDADCKTFIFEADVFGED